MSNKRPLIVYINKLITRVAIASEWQQIYIVQVLAYIRVVRAAL